MDLSYKGLASYPIYDSVRLGKAYLNTNTRSIKHYIAYLVRYHSSLQVISFRRRCCLHSDLPCTCVECPDTHTKYDFM